MSKRKKPTIKELSNLVAENRHGIEIAFKSVDELKYYISGLDKIFDWYLEFKGDSDEFKEFIEKNKTPKKDSDTDGAEDSISDKRKDVSTEKPSKTVSKKSK